MAERRPGRGSCREICIIGHSGCTAVALVRTGPFRATGPVPKGLVVWCLFMYEVRTRWVRVLSRELWSGGYAVRVSEVWVVLAG